MSTVLRPRMSEKTYAISESGVFVFIVESKLNKQEIAKAVEDSYKVDVIKVNVVNQKGKKKRAYRNRKYENGTRSDMKKAYVTLKEGQSIPIFAAVQEAEEKAEKTNKKLEKVADKKAKKDSKKGEK